MTKTTDTKKPIDFDEIEASLNAQLDAEQLRVAKLGGQINGLQESQQKSITNLNKLQGALTLLNQLRKASMVVDVAKVDKVDKVEKE